MVRIRKSLFIILSICLIAVQINLPAIATQQAKEISRQGEVVAKVTTVEGDTLTAADKRGNMYLFKAASPETLKGFNVGDKVKLTVEMEHTTSIQKIKGGYGS
ncbi:MAG TPA: hypothetical protein VHT73_14605 [Thermodesulfobacteriota bacterium]|nr:hypothetical protein [Thermodesulfobacteriota bacterium]